MTGFAILGTGVIALALGLGPGCHSGLRAGSYRADASTSTHPDSGEATPDAARDAGETGVLKLLAGKPGGPGDLDGIGPAARFRNPFAVTTDGAEHLFVADQDSHVVRQIDIGTGAVTTLAGSPGSQGSSDGAGANARFSSPAGMASDGSGNLFVADSGNHTIRKIVIATGAVTTFAGTAGIAGSGDGTGVAAQFFDPVGLASDRTGNLFVADSNNNTIRKVVIATGAVTTLAGSAGTWGSADGTGAAARFAQPSGLACDGSGNLFVADTSGDLIRKLDLATGAVTTLAGLPGNTDRHSLASRGSADGVGENARFSSPTGITSDGSGNLFVADQFNCAIRSIVIATGLVATLAGSAGDCASIDDVGMNARFAAPTGVVSDGAGNLFVADFFNHTIRKVVLATREVTTFAGSPESFGSLDGIGENARFYSPQSVASDGDGNLFVAEPSGQTIRKLVVSTGVVSQFAGSSGNADSIDGIGPAARFSSPRGLAADGLGNLFVIDDSAIRQVVLATGAVTTIAGSTSERGTKDGIGGAARFEFPSALVGDGAGNLFVVDQGDFTLRKVETTTGVVTTLAGLARAGGSADGIGTAALFWNSMGIASDESGNLYVADTGNNTIRKVVIATQQVTTFAGSATSAGSVDGQGTSARFDHPVGIVCDKKGNLFVGDVNNHTIRKIVIATQVVTTVAGTSERMGIVPGPLPAGLSGPTGLALGPSGELFIADSFEHAILAAWF